MVTNRFKVSFNSAIMKISPKLDGIHVLELETLQATLKISTMKTEPKPTTFLATLEISWAAQNIDQNMLDFRFWHTLLCCSMKQFSPIQCSEGMTLDFHLFPFKQLSV